MRTPKISTKRVLGLGLAAALAIGATVAVAQSSEAATSGLTLSPKTGPGASAGAVITITGKNFLTAAGTAAVAKVDFNPATSCPAASADANLGTRAIVSSTKMTVTVPSLALGASNATKAYVVCAYNSGGALVGAGKYSVYAVATISQAIAPTSGSVLGGNTVGIVGTNFTKAAKVTFDGVASPKVTYIDANNLTAVAPAHAAATARQVVVTTEAGDATVATATWNDYDYKNAVDVTPNHGDGTAGNVISVTGSGFKSVTFGTATGNSDVGLVNASLAQTAGTVTAGTVIPTATLCTNIQVVSDTELTCTLPAVTAYGGYQAVVFVRGATATQAAAGTSYFSVDGSYTVAPF